MKGLPFWQIALIGFALVVTGLVLAWLMALRIIPTSFLLGLVSIGTSTAGLMIGLVGSAWQVAKERRKREQ